MVISKKTLCFMLFIGVSVLNYVLLASENISSDGSADKTVVETISVPNNTSTLTVVNHLDEIGPISSVFEVVFVVAIILLIVRGCTRRSAVNHAKDMPSVKVSTLPYQERMTLAIDGPTLVFDGVCHLCNGSMKWFQERCSNPVWYMWCQHEDTQSLLSEYAISREDILQSWALIENGVVYRGSTAWLRAMRNLKRPWSWISYVEYIVPEGIRETVYLYIGRNRYRVFGQSTDCQRPNKAMKSRMVHSIQVSHEKKSVVDISKLRTRKRLLVVGCGPSGLLVAKRAKSCFDVVVCEPREFFEFTPGILRGMCDPDEMKQLHCPLRPVLVDHLGFSWVQGVVTELGSRRATVKCASRPPDLDSKFIASTSSSSDSLLFDIEFEYCVIAVGSAYHTSPLWKVSPNPYPEGTFTMALRMAQMTEQHEQLQKLNAEGRGCVVIVGAGLVGVELAAEICTFYPRIEIIELYDLQPVVIPTLPGKGQDYAAEWLTKHGVTIKTSATLDEIRQAQETSDVVYSCIGVRSTAPSFMPASTMNEKGEVIVNTAMQVVQRQDELESGSGSESNTLFGGGRIFSVGDCVKVEGLPDFIKDTYPAEAMVGIATKNLRRSLTVQCVKPDHKNLMNHIKPLMQITLCSLGPKDCILIVNGIFIANGRLASFMKDAIQYTKMSEARSEFFGTALWYFVPHF